MFRRTTDGGETWKNVFIDTASNPNRPDYLNMPSIYDIAYPNEKLFIGVGDSGVIVRTTDKGETWSKMKYDTNIAFGTICMMDKKFGIISGCAGNCDNDSNFINLVTDDGGLTWDKLNSNLILDISEANILNKNLIYGIIWMKNIDTLWKHYLMKIQNSWTTFDTISPPLIKNLLHLSIINENKIWLSGGVQDFKYLPNTTQIIVSSKDGGLSWEIQRNQKKNGCPILSMKFFDENYGMATSCMGLVLVTINGGKTWRETTAMKIDSTYPMDYDFDNLQIPSVTTAFATCDGSYIYKYTRDWADGVEEQNTDNNSFTISPNPSSLFIKLNFPPSYQTSQIKIYSIEGIEVYSEPSEGLKPSEGYKIDVSGFAPGVYYVKVGDRVCRFIKL